jgi:inhibitor of KinA sporulation pathway (predicted exonuclease)
MTKIVVDVEATCSDKNALFPRHEMEIIEIGACALNDKLEIIGEFDMFIRPIRNPILTDFCKDLTTITQEQVDTADMFPVVNEKFTEWVSQFESPSLNSWGRFDKTQLLKDCEFHGVDLTPLLRGYHINLSYIFQCKYGNHGKARGRTKFGVYGALKHLGMDFEGTHHRGIDDARNISRIVPFITMT